MPGCSALWMSSSRSEAARKKGKDYAKRCHSALYILPLDQSMTMSVALGQPVVSERSTPRIRLTEIGPKTPPPVDHYTWHALKSAGPGDSARQPKSESERQCVGEGWEIRHVIEARSNAVMHQESRNAPNGPAYRQRRAPIEFNLECSFCKWCWPKASFN
jgi:hypothetical protein